MEHGDNKRLGVRPAQHLLPWREPVAPKPAATVLLLRDGEAGLEVLMTRRSTKASFAPGAFVFPGGVVDQADALALDLDPALLSPNRLANWRNFSPDEQEQLHRIYAQAALRESYEEVHLLLVRPNREAHELDQHALASLKEGLGRHPPEGFAQALGARGLVAAIDEVRSFSHWTTDRDLPKRFDVRFLVARAPMGQMPVADEGEQFEPCWVQPREALERHSKGLFYMIFPTIRTLQQLSHFKYVDDVLSESDRLFKQGKLWRSCPRGGFVLGKDERFTEDDMQFAELELVSPDGQLVHKLDWQHESPVGLLRYLYRYTAPNPGRMTGPGTNTYILGREGDWTVVDPGPAIAEHVDRLRSFTKDKITRILCTHSHLDHSPAAFALQSAIEKALGVRVPILGRASGPSIEADQAFIPDQTLEDGDRLRICDDVHLRAIHTPGHASNHLCFLLEEDGILLSGDHVMNGSTVVINPPDGDMFAYIASLERLEHMHLNYVLPAHGYVLGKPAQEIRKLIRHRLLRESKVLESLKRLCTDHPDQASESGFTVEDIVPGAYQDVATSLHGLAARSLFAHLLKLKQDGKVFTDGKAWSLETI
jgi:glyoxylase-like metal-dependent hydrolase (beta-lactamase superfamily II)/8-oxo-dGTP pyrophosphatase MutT (NUDIX family)